MTSSAPYAGPAWAISLKTIGLGDDWHETKIYAVAVSDPSEALDAVKKTFSTTPDQTVAIAGPLSEATMASLQLAPGQVWLI